MSKRSTFRVSDAYSLANDLAVYIEDNELSREEGLAFIEQVAEYAVQQLPVPPDPSHAPQEGS